MGDEKAPPPATESRRPSHSESTSTGVNSSNDHDGFENSEKLDRLDSRIVKVNKNTDPFSHLPSPEREILAAQVQQPEVDVSYLQLFKYASARDKGITIFACICAIIGGSILPLMTVVFGQLAGVFGGFFAQPPTLSPTGLRHEVSKYTLYFVYMAIAEFIFVYVSTVAFIVTGEHIAGNIRKRYLTAVLRQNVGYFDKLGAGEITTRITADTSLVQDGVSQKVGLTLTALATFFSAFIIAFIKSWKLTLILGSTVFAITGTMAIASRFLIKYNKASVAAYAIGGTVAEESLSSIRNAHAFGTQDKLAALYTVHLTEAEKWGLKNKTVLGFMLGSMMCIVYLNYGLAFWQGSRFLVKDEIHLNQVLTVLMAIMIGAFSMGNVAPNIQAFTTAIAAAAKIYSTIDRKGPLDSSSNEGQRPAMVDGAIEFRNVKHIYPSRPEVVVVSDLSLVVPAGKVTALVGASGSGKSTIVHLVERFYDPVGGQVLLDGRDVRDLNLRWLRENMSLVQQEPVLFGTSIFENVAHGLIGTQYQNASHDKKTELVHSACEMANANIFIESLPDGYETHVGERGFLLSGGQKQRIAIARAVVGDPKILLLDEATSALDTRSEGVVQHALEKASQGRTTIVIAHRLSTIKTANKIVVMSHGRIVEEGTHDELIDRRAAYFNLVEAQKIAAENDEAAAKSEGELINDQERAYTVDPDDDMQLVRTATSKSKSSIVLAAKAAEDKNKYSLWALIKVVGSFNKEEKAWMIFGSVMCVLAGAGYPIQSIFFGKSITALSLGAITPINPTFIPKIRHEANFWSVMYLMLAVVQLITYSGQGWAFARCSERLIHRARDRAFRTMLRQDMAYFDKDENTSGALTSFLSTQTTYIAGLSGTTLGTLLIVSTTLFGGIGVALGFAWKIGLVCTATIPILLACGFLRFWILAHFERKSKAAYEKSASYACEATAAIRTVASLTREEDVVNHYYWSIEAQERVSFISTLKSSTLYAASQSLVFLCVALGFWYGGGRLAAREYGMLDFFVAFTSIIFGAQSAGTIFSFAPDMGKAKAAAQELKILFDRKPEIDTWSADGVSVPNIEGYIEFRDVHFRYPSRPTQPVLRGLNLLVKPGNYVALCGPSGCGKSTTVALMERFYDPLTGGVFVDGRDIATLNLKEYRSHLALVSQEPTLYQGTVRENILLGSGNEDDSLISEEMIIKACKDANIYDFIASLPDGLNTLVGSKGTMLSGGQKQRIAIARALIRNPKILLLDEATSALDSESEKVVQAALDAAAKGRTTIAVAHRLSTIQKADVIYVFDQGRIMESGTHHELMQRKGRYFELVNLQSLGKNQ